MVKKRFNIASFFSGAGGLDLGFENAGFELAFANDNWSGCWETFEKNHRIEINRKSISDIKPEEIPEVIGFVGGPPCQSWSLAGMMRGVEDNRGQLFYEYLKLLQKKRPLFFLAENVAGIVSKTHLPEFQKIIKKFKRLGYKVNWKLLNAKNYGVPQERKRVIVVGYRNDLNKKFDFDKLQTQDLITLKEVLGDLPESTMAKEKTTANDNLEYNNHEHIKAGFSPMYMSRNRRKNWDQQSFTIQASSRHVPLHPDSPEMINIGPDERIFENKNDPELRRLSVRECARVQTFPDNYIFHYKSMSNGYKMIGNAVPVKLAEVIAKQIMKDLKAKSY